MIKNKERIRKYGEVFTPEWLVKDMVDLAEPIISDPYSRALEPTCGNGNFLVEILIRRLANSNSDIQRLAAINNLFGIELLPDNVDECKRRLLGLVPEHLTWIAERIFDRNIVCGNFLRPETVWFLNEENALNKAFDYEQMVKIDQYNLDREWQEQANNVLVCMQALADARKELDRAKEEYDLIVAEVDREIRDSSDKKPSEKAIEGMVLMDERVQEAKANLTEAKYNVNMLEAARAGLENKREALTNLVKLHGMNYYAEPTADIEARGQLEDMRQEAVRNKIKIGDKAKDQSEPVRRKK